MMENVKDIPYIESSHKTASANVEYLDSIIPDGHDIPYYESLHKEVSWIDKIDWNSIIQTAGAVISVCAMVLICYLLIKESLINHNPDRKLPKIVIKILLIPMLLITLYLLSYMIGIATTSGAIVVIAISVAIFTGAYKLKKNT